ncbi:MAG TPA: phytanoyl-CoA dioxygenase family protein [Pyrinomonadaceae bacterium]|nr:phytanoyl-CoA dioxygenase family protein [Pyrinomonadaceae bacterium]
MAQLTEAHRQVTSNSPSAELWSNGHVLVRQVASTDDISHHRAAITGAVRRLSNETRSIEERSTYDKAFLQVMNLWEKDEAVKRFVFEKRFAQIAADLLGVEAVRLYHDQALFKEPAGGPTPWHQDKYYWPLDTDKMITMWMPLVDVDDQMGMVRFATGSHEYGAVENVGISDESEERFARFVSENQFEIANASFMKAGDATFHLGWTIHSAGANRSDKMREVMTIIYFADGARVTEPNSMHQQADLETWLGGRLPGDAADSESNPIMN